MTRRLYYEDPFLRKFEATVAEAATLGGGPAVALDATAFYPGGGGQPPDHGEIGGVRVSDVSEIDGRIWHRLEAPLLPGSTVGAAIDWARRFDHMQQHTGQHILSQAFIEVAGAETRSFHLGEEDVVIDVGHPGPDAPLLASVEDRANEVVWEDREVRIHDTAPEDLGRFPLRKPPTVAGRVRIVEIDGFDWSACGGTHVLRAGQVGAISILHTERYKGGTRVAFVCGGRAVRRSRRQGALLRDLCLEFTSGEADLPKAVARLKEERGRAERRLKELVQQSLEREADAMVAEAPRGVSGPVVARHFPDRDFSEVGILAALIAGRGGIAILAAGEETPRAQFSAPGGTMSMGALLGGICRRFGGKGGGRPESAQGAIPRSSLDAALEAARAAALAGTAEGPTE